MDKTNKLREREKKVITLMISVYCRKKHKTKSQLCGECSELLDYSYQRIDKCPFIETKTFCSQCEVKCYRPEKSEKIRQVMRFSGPRMLYHHPVLAVRHLYYTLKGKNKNN
ncbi:MAG TPA: nitrous oxide-stimulated promoter family protein [Clostridiales bacterium]|nr:nitrous oxide-stimulated promoter family protein [Clostridiales bacterium]